MSRLALFTFLGVLLTASLRADETGYFCEEKDTEHGSYMVVIPLSETFAQIFKPEMEDGEKIWEEWKLLEPGVGSTYLSAFGSPISLLEGGVRVYFSQDKIKAHLVIATPREDGPLELEQLPLLCKHENTIVVKESGQSGME